MFHKLYIAYKNDYTNIIYSYNIMEYTSMEISNDHTGLNSHNITPEHELKPKEEKVVEDADKAAAAEKEVEEPKKDLDNMKKWKYTLITTVIFLIVANPYTYMFVNMCVKSIFGKRIVIASATGCPTIIGLLLHAVVFTLLLRWVMDWKL